jgi:ubiquinone biosynthesis protein Coq4
MMAQTSSPVSPLLIGGKLIISALKNPGETREIVDKVSQGWKMGRAAQPIFAIDWESNWETPLEKLRYEYDVNPAGFLIHRSRDHKSDKTH